MTEIALRAASSTPFSLDEVRQVVDTALRREAELADARRAYFARQCSDFEQKHQLSTKAFLRKFESGQLGDDADYFDWYAYSKLLARWRKAQSAIRSAIQ